MNVVTEPALGPALIALLRGIVDRAEDPRQTQTVDVSIGAAGDCQAILDRRQRDDLPRFSAVFQRALKENTIREIANFQAQLQREQRDIQDRIDAISRSLSGIDYNLGRDIVLVSAATGHADATAFRQDLRRCTENTLGTGEDESYSEAKYQQVAAIIDRLHGRVGLTDADRRWRDLSPISATGSNSAPANAGATATPSTSATRIPAASPGARKRKRIVFSHLIAVIAAMRWFDCNPPIKPRCIPVAPWPSGRPRCTIDSDLPSRCRRRPLAVASCRRCSSSSRGCRCRGCRGQTRP